MTGFQKRKLERKKKAQEKLQQQLKEERKRLKQDAKEAFRKLVKSRQPIPDLEHLLEDQYEDDDVTVKVVEISATSIAEQNNWIGPNTPKYEDDEVVEHVKLEEEEDIPGMSLKKVVKKEPVEENLFTSEKEIKKVLKKQATKNIQKSKIFMRKSKMDRQKQKKKAVREKEKQLKLHRKRNKRKGKSFTGNL